MKSTIRTQRILYFILWAVILLWVTLAECDILPTAFLPDTPEAAYWGSMAVIITTLGGTFFALRLMVMKPFGHHMGHSDESTARQHYIRLAAGRTLILTIAAICNLLVYYGMATDTSATYGLLIITIATLFCLPGEQEFQSMRQRHSADSNHSAS